MKNILKMTIVVFLLIAIPISSSSQKRKIIVSKSLTLKERIIGKWQICNLSDSLVNTNLGNQKGMTRYKYISEKSFVVFDANTNTKVFFGDFIGQYAILGDVYTENLDYASPGMKSYIGTINTFKIKIKKDLLILKGINNHFSEIWKKVK